jgi:GNAT superfamily N-acetyltransferase
MHIREFIAADYPAVVDIDSRIGIKWPERPETAEGWAAIDRDRNPDRVYQRLVAVLKGETVGFGSYGQMNTDSERPMFFINVEVKPDFQRQGIGAALYDQIRTRIHPFNPKILRADAFTNMPQGFTFLQKRGFYEAFRETPVYLDIASFDLSPFEGLKGKLLSNGIVIKTLNDLKTDTDRDRKLYDLYQEVSSDVPQEDIPVEKESFEEWAKWSLNDPTILHDAYFVAMDGDRFIGLSEWGVEPDGKAVLGGLAGVRRAYRNRGIGLALHLRGIGYAKKHGYKALKTCTAIQNRPMQVLFDKLGFSRYPEWQQCQKDIAE